MCTFLLQGRRDHRMRFACRARPGLTPSLKARPKLWKHLYIAPYLETLLFRQSSHHNSVSLPIFISNPSTQSVLLTCLHITISEPPRDESPRESHLEPLWLNPYDSFLSMSLFSSTVWFRVISIIQTKLDAARPVRWQASRHAAGHPALPDRTGPLVNWNEPRIIHNSFRFVGTKVSFRLSSPPTSFPRIANPRYPLVAHISQSNDFEKKIWWPGRNNVVTVSHSCQRTEHNLVVCKWRVSVSQAVPGFAAFINAGSQGPLLLWTAASAPLERTRQDQVLPTRSRDHLSNHKISAIAEINNCWLLKTCMLWH